MNFHILAIFTIISSNFALAFENRFTCTAKVTNRTFTVALDLDSLMTHIDTDNGFKYQGYSVFHYSPFVKYKSWTLHGGFYAGTLTLLMDPTQGDKASLCLSQNECYRCQ